MPASSTTWQEWRARARPVPVGDLHVAAYDLGERGGPALTFLHGYPSSSLDLAPVLPHLPGGLRVVAVDHPGFGASAKPPDHPYSIHSACDAVEAVWQELGVDRTVVAAHDYSVSVGQELLARHAERALGVDLSGMVMMNGGLYPDLHRPTAGQEALLDPDHGADVAAAVTEEAFLRGTGATWGRRVPVDEAAVREMYRSMDESGGVRLMHRLLHYIADRRTHADRWSRVLETTDVPLTFVWGDLDPVSGAHMIGRVEERCPGARVVRLADVGHWPTLEAPEVVAAEIAGMAHAGS